MGSEITIITTPFYNLLVNCYLVKTGTSSILIDTGWTGGRGAIEAELLKAGCLPGNLACILLTHGDFDHCGNATHFRKKFGTPIGMHGGDVGMLQHGDMFWKRTRPNILIRTVAEFFIKLDPADRGAPDWQVADGDHLAAYGFDAQVVHIPGHSTGSIGFLTGSGELFCGDLLANVKQPSLWSIMDNATAARASVEKLRRLPITTVYPGHGAPFPMEALAT